MIWITLPLSLLCAVGDYRLYRHLVRENRWSHGLRVALFALLIFTALLSPIVSFVGRWLIQDNSPAWVAMTSHLNILYFVVVMPRIMLYLGWRWFKRVGLILGGVCTLIFWALMAWGIIVESTSIEVRRVEISHPDLPAGFDGVVLAQFSDLHVGALRNPQADCRVVVDSILAQRPDLIFFTGDLIHIRPEELTDEVIGELGRLKAPMGSYSVMGNHDTGQYTLDSLRYPRDRSFARHKALQRRIGWTLLEDRSLMLYRNGDSITLSGVEFDLALRNFRHKAEMPADRDLLLAYRGVDSTLFNLTICHLPQLWDSILEAGYGDLMLSGHVHSMQHKLPFGKRGWSLARLLYKRWSGHYREGKASLYINDGIASIGIPVRLGAPPEITIITLRKA